MKKKTSILHISDLHLSESPILNSIPTFNNLNILLSEIIDRKFEIDLCLITGDISHDANPDNYKKLKKLLNSCPWPIKILSGNHDDFIIGNQLLGDNYWPKDDIWKYDVDDTVVIGINSSVKDYNHGEISSKVINKLTEFAKSIPQEKEWLIALHHPPVNIGHWWMDAQGLIKGREDLLLIADKYKAKAILCGHVHISSTVYRKGTPIIIAPSVSHDVIYDDALNRPLRLRISSPKGLLHYITVDNLTTINLTIGGNSWLVNGRDWQNELKRTNKRLPANK